MSFVAIKLHEQFMYLGLYNIKIWTKKKQLYYKYEVEL